MRVKLGVSIIRERFCCRSYSKFDKKNLFSVELIVKIFKVCWKLNTCVLFTEWSVVDLKVEEDFSRSGLARQDLTMLRWSSVQRLF